jgi:hypothetical protein
MNRLVTVIVGSVILVLVGYFLGARPVGGLKDELSVAKEQHAIEIEALKVQASDALGEGYLWQARAQLLVAAQDVGANNFGTAASRVTNALELLQTARTLPNLSINLGEVEGMVIRALKAAKALDPIAGSQILGAASELGLLLERKQA